MSKPRNAPDPFFDDLPDGLDDFSRELEKAAEMRGARKVPPRPKAAPDTLPAAGIDIMVIGDAHAGPNQSLRRFRWFGKMAAVLQPAVIVSIGDWADMESCGSFDRPGSVKFAAKDFWADVDAAVAARSIFEDALGASKAYQPRKLETLGNHEHRIARIAEADSRFAGVFTYDVLRHAEHGWERHDFLAPVQLAGFTVVHYLTNPGTGKPIGGVGANPLRLAYQKVHTPFIVGHSHRWDRWRETDMHGRAADCFNAGCSFEHDEDWAGFDNRYWTRGILMLRNCRAGTADAEWWSLERVRREFGP